MVFLNWKELPFYWYGFNWFPYAALMIVLVPGALAFVFGWFAFRSRVTGVYLSIITQALTYALMLGFFRNNFGFGGNNGLTDFKDILGFNVQSHADARRAVRALGRGAGARLSDRPGGGALQGRQGADRRARRGEPHALPRLPRRELQDLRVHAVGLHGGGRRRALRAAGRHHQSERVRARQLHRVRDLGRRRRPRHADRRRARRGARQLRQDHVHDRLARALLAVRAGRHVRAGHDLPAEGRAGPAAERLPRLRGQRRARAAPARAAQPAE